MLIWSPGRVARVADGLTDQRSARARKILPAGALLWAWDANADFNEREVEMWLILLPDKWNRQVHYGWRFDPAQLREDADRVATGTASPSGGVPRRRARGRRAADAQGSSMTDDEG